MRHACVADLSAIQNIPLEQNIHCYSYFAAPFERTPCLPCLQFPYLFNENFPFQSLSQLLNPIKYVVPNVLLNESCVSKIIHSVYISKLIHLGS